VTATVTMTVAYLLLNVTPFVAATAITSL